MALRKRVRALLMAGALVTAMAAVAYAALPQQSGTVDLATQANVEIDGAAASDSFGAPVAPAGDFNGDGLGDVIGADFSANFAWIVFGRRDAGKVDLSNPGTGAIKISGGPFDSVAGAGDVNGDGIADVVVGKSASNAAWVIFGSKTPANVDVTALGSGGFQFTGAASDGTGAWVAGAGDMNKDGYADIVLGSPSAGNGGAGSGGGWVVFGSPSTTAVTAAALGSRGFRIDGAIANEGAGSQVAGGTDLNGDGVPDVLIGADNATYPASFTAAGAVYAVFGKSSNTTVSLANVDAGTGGYRIDGSAANDQIARSLAMSPDMNGDGLGEALIGSSFNNSSTGSVWVVFGKASGTVVSLASLGSGGFRINGQAASDQFGRSLGSTGDVNGDGIPDLIAGALFADNNGRVDSGSAYVIFGRSATSTISTSSLGSAGFRIDGALAGDNLGRSAGGAGDFNGDGRPDVAADAEFADPSGRSNAGEVFVTYGFGPASVSYSPASISGTVGTAIAPLTPTIKRTGTPSFAVAPALPAGLSLDAATGVISGTPTAAAAAADYTVTMTDLSGTATTTVNVAVTGGIVPPPCGAACVTAPPPPVGACVVKKTGTSAADVLTGTQFGDLIHGGKGNDKISGLAGADCLYGDAGNDKIDGGAGNDKLFGGPGNDTLTGGKGKDSFDGGPGNDTINSADGVKETVKCGKGRDKVKADKKDRLVGCEKVKRVR